MLIHVQQINHGWHQHDASADAQQSYEHAADKSEQKNCNGHGIQNASRKWPRSLQLSPLFSTVLLSAATSVENAVTLTNAHVFLFAWNLLYLLVSVTSAVWPAGMLLDHLGSQVTLDPRTYRSVDSGRMGVNNDKECCATHAYRTEAGIFQRRPTEGSHHRLRLCGPATGAAICRSGAQSHGI